MRNREIECLLDNLRQFSITGKDEYKQSALKLMDCLIRFDNSVIDRTKRILEMNGFKVYHDGSIKTKKGIIEAPII